MNYIRNKIVNRVIDMCSHERKSGYQSRNEIYPCKTIAIKIRSGMNFHFIRYLCNELCHFISQTFVEIFLPVKFRWISFREEVKNVSDARVAILFFKSARQNTNLVEDIEILLPIKFRWILLSIFRGKVENASANQRPGGPSCFSDRPEKHNLKENVEIMLPVMFRWIPFNGLGGEVSSRKCLNQSEARAAVLFFRSTRKHNLVEDVEISQSEAGAAKLGFQSVRKTQTW